MVLFRRSPRRRNGSIAPGLKKGGGPFACQSPQRGSLNIAPLRGFRLLFILHLCPLIS